MDNKTIAIIAVIAILIVAIGAGLFLTQNKNTKPADTNKVANTTNNAVNTTNTTTANTTSNAPSPNDYYIDEDGEREYYYDDYYDRDGPYD